VCSDRVWFPPKLHMEKMKKKSETERFYFYRFFFNSFYKYTAIYNLRGVVVKADTVTTDVVAATMNRVDFIITIFPGNKGVVVMFFRTVT
jgi:hypothetical protein